ncbi:hypothetical protein NUH16_000664 [Penicillium rubens]|uniref:uncharacterized protein n=1 Tax=Penicillium rubens TaxID=1108849 RepID=UPI002A59960D|nr:uncharacterized protein N7525_005461 [Penicillium rubens]KAJ5043871.1 hypothetical protein NUH16_000664 [Penicillium rubens]KAJ5840273.1 hypothetical protein N7525_005461 [Penicillium rubens]
MAARIRGYDNNHGTGAMPVIPNDATSNVEYVSGGAYYIHTKATPHLYWSIRNGNNGFITLDTRRQPNSESIAMTRESLHQHRKMIALSLKDGIQLLALSSSGSHNIGVMGQSVSLYNGDFGDAWDEKLKYTAVPTLAYKLEYAGEEWELVH